MCVTCGVFGHFMRIVCVVALCEGVLLRGMCLVCTGCVFGRCGAEVGVSYGGSID